MLWMAVLKGWMLNIYRESDASGNGWMHFLSD
jgi:hypothetical protein